MCHRIMALYTSPTVRVCVNSHLSDAFPLCNGTRQGCPLSPILYVISLEPFFNRLCANLDIEGVQVGDKVYKVSAFADDILLFLDNPPPPFPTS